MYGKQRENIKLYLFIILFLKAQNCTLWCNSAKCSRSRTYILKTSFEKWRDNKWCHNPVAVESIRSQIYLETVIHCSRKPQTWTPCVSLGSAALRSGARLQFHALTCKKTNNVVIRIVIGARHVKYPFILRIFGISLSSDQLFSR